MQRLNKLGLMALSSLQNDNREGFVNGLCDGYLYLFSDNPQLFAPERIHAGGTAGSAQEDMILIHSCSVPPNGRMPRFFRRFLLSFDTLPSWSAIL